MKLILITLLIFVLFNSESSSKTVYVSTTGLDTNPGTLSLPFKTITKALTAGILPGDTILVRGGVYVLTTTITMNTSPSGKPDTLCHLYAYPGERPILDFSTQALGSRALQIKASYWHVRGFDIKGAGDNGINISGSFNTIEFCATYECRDSGVQLGGGANNNRIINCDSYYNMDPSEGNADGFSPKLDVGTNNYFYGCRAWQNTDDGFDGYLRASDNINTILDNCWTFMNGYHKDWTISVDGNGNGFKMGGSDLKNLRHNITLYNCLTFDNKVKGFDQNNNKGSMTLINCTAYRNGSNNYSVGAALDTGKVLTVTNSLAYGPMGTLLNAIQTTNSWMRPDSVTRYDFISIDTTGVRGPRKSDGSLPDINFLHLATGSQLINGGTIVPGRTYFGIAPDLGCFEDTTPPPPTTFQVSVDVNAGWNMVSIPGLHPTNQNVDTWWPFKALNSSVFQFNGSYQAVTVAENGKGYWMRHSDTRTYNTGDEWPAGGITIVPNNPIPGNAGWNMLGCYNYNVATSGITTSAGSVVGSIFGYSGGYNPVTTLLPGYGYWIRLSQAADIILPNAGFKGAAKVASIDDKWGKIILTDNSGRNYTLYASDKETDLSQFDMPPAPPSGMMDVRYESQRYVENITEGFKTIDFHGMEYPVTVRVEGMSIRLQDQTGKAVRTILKPGEKISVSNSEINKLMVSGDVIPDEYSLSQNYPNPFNPGTVIEFTIPEDVHNVTLTIYDALGQKVAEILNGSLQAGYYKYNWNAGQFASGIYIYQLRTEKFISNKKMMLMK